MPPKIRISREDIINTALEIVRKSGADSVNARALATELNCSTQPIFSNFSSMDELKLAVVEKADLLCSEYITNELKNNEYPVYKATGMAYIRFAKEEKELFKLLYMRNRSFETTDKISKTDDIMEPIIKQTTGLDGDDAKLFHLEMWACVHGIAAMFATGFLDLDQKLVSKMITDTYQGLRKHYGLEDKNNG